MGQAVLLDREDRVAIITINRPEVMNSLNPAANRALSDAFDDFQNDPDQWVAIITGAGDRAFSAGGDPRHMQEMRDDLSQWWRTMREAKRIVFNMLECDKPIVARVNGHAVGFGCTLALASDIIVAVEDAKIGDPHVNTGLVCGDGGAFVWPLQIGMARAKEFLFTGELITAKEAAAIGLINHAVPREELDAKVMDIAGRIARGATRSIQLTKNTLNAPLRQHAHTMMDLGLANELLSALSEDHQEAIHAFIEKRDPKFTGS